MQGGGGVQQLAVEPLGGAHGADQDDQRRGGALLSGVAERGVHHVLGGQVQVGAGGDDQRVLAGGLGQQRQVLAEGAEQLRGLVPAGEDDLLHVRVGDQALADLLLAAAVQGQEGDQVVGVLDPGLAQALADGLERHGAGAGRLRGGLEHHGRTGGERGQHTAHGDGHREVPRRDDQGQLGGLERGAAHLVQSAGQTAVVAREVDGLGDLRVTLVQGLAGLGGGHLEQVRSALLELVPDPLQHGLALGPGEGTPGLAGLHSLPDDVLHLGNGAHLGLADRVHPQGGGGDVGDDLASPFPVGRQRGVGVRGVGEAVHRCRDIAQVPGQTVLVAGRRRDGQVHVLHGGQEALLLTGEQALVRVQLEHRGHEVLLAGALLQAADQVGDGHVELSGVHHGGVEQQRADVLLHGLGLTGGHAQQHLELHIRCVPGCRLLGAGHLGAAVCGRRGAVVGLAALHVLRPRRGEPTLPDQQQGQGDVEEVVPGHADAHVAGALGGQGVVEHALVVGVGGLLGGAGGDRPAHQGGLHLLHGQVGALDHADLDGRATGLHAAGGPLLQADHGVQRVRQVGLQHDPGGQILQLGLVHQAHEHGQGHVQVVVLLHVQVDERGGVVLGGVLSLAGGQLVERQQVLGDLGDGLVERPRAVRGGGGGDLDRDVVHVRTLDQRADPVQAALGLLLAQDGLAEQVDVQTGAGLLELGDRGAQLGLGGVHDQVRDQLAQHLAGHRDGDLGHERGDLAAGAHGRLHVPGQEARDHGGQLAQRLGGDLGVLRADHAVHEAHGEVQTVGVLEHSGQLARGEVRRVLTGILQPGLDLLDGGRGQASQVSRVWGVGERERGGAGSGRGVVRRGVGSHGAIVSERHRA